MKTYRFGFHMSNELNSYLNKNVKTLSIAILKSFYFINIKIFYIYYIKFKFIFYCDFICVTFAYSYMDL